MAAGLRGVEEGETYTVTRRGVPVAMIVPIGSSTGPRLDRPARKRTRFADRKLVTSSVPTSEILDDLRGDR